MVNPALLNIEVVYANPERQMLIALQVEQGATVSEAINKSGILLQFPEIDLAQNKIGIFSKTVTLETTLQAGDRIEIYHPLLIDPKMVRKLRAKQQRSQK